MTTTPLRLLMIATLLALLPQWGCTQDVAWPLVMNKVRSDFPTVTQISTDSLKTWMASGAEQPVLLDVRMADEYAVSHLEGAQRVNPDAESFAFLDDLPRDTPIVTYCSVGYRSSQLAQRLQEAGFTNVANLEGSIFRWANEGLPVYRDHASVGDVHPYDNTWGRLLNKPYRTFEPRTEEAEQ